MRVIKRFDFEDMEDEETVLALAEAYMVPPIRTSEGLPDNIEIADMIYRNRQGLDRTSIPSLLHGTVIDRFSGLASWPDEPPDEEPPAPVPADPEPKITATSTMTDVQRLVNAEMKRFDDEEKDFRADAGEAAIDLMSAAHRIETAGIKTQNLIDLVSGMIGDADAKALGFPIRGPEDEEDSEEEEEGQSGGEDDDEGGNDAQGPNNGQRGEEGSEDENNENQPPPTQSYTGRLFALPELQLRGEIIQSDASDEKQGEDAAEDVVNKEDRGDTPSDDGNENDENQPPPSQPSRVLPGLLSHGEIIESDASDEECREYDTRFHDEGSGDENDENQPPILENQLRDEVIASDVGGEEVQGDDRVKVDAEGEEKEDIAEEDKEYTPESNDGGRGDLSGGGERPGADEIPDEDNSQCEVNEVANQTVRDDEAELTETEARFVASLHPSNDLLDSEDSSGSSEDDSEEEKKGQEISRVSFSGATESPRSTFRREATPGHALYREESPEVVEEDTGCPRQATSPDSSASSDDEEEDKKSKGRETSRVSFSGQIESPRNTIRRQATPLPRRRLSRKESPREAGRVSLHGLMESPFNTLRRQATPGPGRRLDRDETPGVVEESLAVIERNTGRVSFPGAVASPHNTLRRQATPGPGKRAREESPDEDDEPSSKRSRKEDSPPASVVESERVPKRPRENDDDQEPSIMNKRSRLINGLRESMGYISSWMPGLSAVTAPTQSPPAPAPIAPQPVSQPPARLPSVAGTAIPPRTARRRTPHLGLPWEPEARNYNLNFLPPPPPDRPHVPPPDFVLRPTEWDFLRPIPQPYWPRDAVLLTQEDIDIERRLQDTERMYRERQRAGLEAGRNPMPRQRGFHPSRRPLSGPSNQVEAERSGFPWPPPTGRAAYDAIRRIYGDDRANPALLREENAVAGPSTFATSYNARSVSELPLGLPRPLAIPRMSTPPREPQRSALTSTSRPMFGQVGFQVYPSRPIQTERRKREREEGKGKGKARKEDWEKNDD